MLDLIDCGIGDAGVTALTESPLLAGVRTLVLGCNAVGDAGARAGSPHLAGLKHLHLHGCGIEADGALAASPHLGRLNDLELSHNAIGDEAALALAESSALASLRRLVLVRAGLTVACERELKRRHGGRVHLD